jgi:PAS domain S-box-containing protein
MFGLDSTLVGILVALLGIIFVVIAVMLVRTTPRLRTSVQPAVLNLEDENTEETQEAVLVIQQGGRILSVNPMARSLFGLAEGEIPNLERLARRVRPGERFLNLCAGHGKATFAVEGKQVEAVSYFLSVQPYPLVVLTMRPPKMTAGRDAPAAQSTELIPQLVQAMAASLDLKETLQAVLQNMQTLIPADVWEIAIWDMEAQVFVPYRLVGAEQELVVGAERYRSEDGFTGVLYQTRRPLFLPDVDAQPGYRQAVSRAEFPLRSYLGVPLIVGKDVIGTLEMGSFTRETFSNADLDLMELVSGAVAIAVHNALLYQKEQRRAAELSGLAQLTQAFSSARDPQRLYTHLVQSIAPLLRVEILGFLIYNESSRSLQGQPPIYGLPDQFVELYKVPIVSGSALETALIEQDMIVSANAAEDPQWEVLGLQRLAQSASLRDTVLIPLISSGRNLGYLQASNHVDGSATFTQGELNLLMIVANQTAPLIENLGLVQQLRQRAQRSEALRRITSLSSSAATLDEILTFALQELNRLLRADAALAFLLDSERSVLRLHIPSQVGLPDEMLTGALRMSADDAQFPFTVTGSQRTQNVANLEAEQAIVPFYQAIFRKLNGLSLVGVPLVVHNEGVGELWFVSRELSFFDQTDIQTIVTAAGQLAGVVEQSYLAAQTDESLRRRVEQMTALTRISRELGSSLDFKSLLQLVYAEALRATRADCGSILFFDLNRPGTEEKQLVRFYVGDLPSTERTPLELQALETREVVTVDDLAASEYPAPHEGVQSIMLVPVLYRQRIAGLISLHARSTGCFDKDAVEIAQSLAAQAAVALGNAFQYEDQARRGELLKRELETLSKLFQVSQFLRPGQPLEDALGAIAQAIQDATPFQVVLISMIDPNDPNTLRRICSGGLSQQAWDDLRTRSQPWKGAQVLLLPEYRFGSVYFIPADKRPVIPQEVHLYTVLPLEERQEVDAWNPKDLLLVPLYDSEGKPLGMVSADAPRDGRRPDRPTLEALELLATQAGLVMENHRQMTLLEKKVNELKEEAWRLQQSAQDVQESLPILLHRQLEQMIVVQNLNRRSQRVQAGLEMAEEATRQTDSNMVLRVMAREMLTRLDLQTALIAEKSPSGVRLTEVLGTVPSNVNPDALFGQRNPLRQALNDGRILMAALLNNENEWYNSPLLQALNAQSFIVAPVKISEQRSAAILAIGQSSMGDLSKEDELIFERLASQVGVGLQNLELLNETRRRLREVNLLLEFSRKLGTLSPESILQELVSSLLDVIPGAQAGWVGLLEVKNQMVEPRAARGYVDNNSLLAIRYSMTDNELSLPADVLIEGNPRTVNDLNFAQQYLLSSDDLLAYRQASNGKLPISTLAVPLRLGERVLGVVILENFEATGAFSSEDESLALSLAQQTALALESARLFVSAEERASQLQALTQVAATISTSLQFDELITSLLDLLKSVVPYDTATLWLRRGEQLMVAAASGFADAESRLGLSVNLEDSILFQEMIRTNTYIYAPDVRADGRFPSLVEPDFYAWLGIPVVAKGELIGAIALEKKEASFYTPEYVQAAVTFAGQAGVALENARLFEESVRRTTELDERSQRLALLNRFSGELSSSLEVDHILELTVEQLMAALGADHSAALLVDEEGQVSLHYEAPPVENERLPRKLPLTPLLARLSETFGIFSTTDVSAETDLRPLLDAYLQRRKVTSLLVVPIMYGVNLHGWLMLMNAEERRYTPSEIELARTITNQAGIAVQNARLFVETRSLKEALEKRVEERTAELSREHQNSQTLLRIIMELSTSLDLEQVLSRTLAVLNESLGCEQSLIVLATRDRQYQAGMALAGGESGNLRAEKEISRWVVRRRAPALVDDIQTDTRWKFAEGMSFNYRSLVAVPLVLGEDVLGSLILLHRQPSFFTLDQVGLMEVTARQIGIALNNAELFTLIRDQAEDLGAMLRDQQVEASRSRGILEAVADGVLVTNASNQVSLFNASAERILGIRAEQIIGKPLDQFVGMFGKTSIDWVTTIRTWTQSPAQYAEAEVYTEQIELDNGRIVSVHLAPVIWRNEFLGTVSTFRDITHEVQVDRLKSEFVANVSHELRTPLTSIKGYVDIMLMGATGQLNSQQKHFLEVVRGSTARLSVLINDLLDLSHIETGQVKLEWQSLDLRKIGEEVLAQMEVRSKDESRPMRFTLEAPDDLPQVRGDYGRIKQVLMSLVLNGYNYTPDDGLVRVVMHVEGNELQVDVVDTGVGIAPEEQGRIFERFYRGNDPLVLATAGTGLGLAMSKTLVEMHRGRIWFISSGVRGEGSTFSFALPIEQTEG